MNADLIPYLLATYALIQTALLVWSFRWQSHQPWRLWFLRAMLLGMIYDNSCVALAPYFIGTNGYVAANAVRFFMHSAVLPFLTLFAWSVMRDANCAVADRAWFGTFCWAFTIAALAYGLWHEVYLLELGPTSALGFEKLSSTSGLPPIATILTNILILPLAALIWRQSGWHLFFAGALFIFALNGATGGQPWGFLAGNVAEIAFVTCLLLTERRFKGEARSS